MRLAPTLVLTVVVATAGGCAHGVSGPSEANAAPRFDRPAPPSSPRAEVSLVVTLPPSTDCEERFDLALYKDPAIEQIAWDEPRGKCHARKVAIRYLSSRRTEADVLAAVRKLSAQAEVTKGGAR